MRTPPATSLGEFVRDITSTPEEFDASLRQAAAGCLEGGFPSYRVAAGDVRLRIDVVPGAERRIALVRLPTLIATYRFTGGSRTAQEALLARLDRAMHRGGG